MKKLSVESDRWAEVAGVVDGSRCWWKSEMDGEWKRERARQQVNYRHNFALSCSTTRLQFGPNIHRLYTGLSFSIYLQIGLLQGSNISNCMKLKFHCLAKELSKNGSYSIVLLLWLSADCSCIFSSHSFGPSYIINKHHQPHLASGTLQLNHLCGLIIVVSCLVSFKDEASPLDGSKSGEFYLSLSLSLFLDGWIDLVSQIYDGSKVISHSLEHTLFVFIPHACRQLLCSCWSLSTNDANQHHHVVL